MARGRALAKVVSARQAIFKEFASTDKIERVSWLPKQVYEEVKIPLDWSTQLERETFDYPTKEEDAQNLTFQNKQLVSDKRFASTPEAVANTEQALEVADAIEAALDREEELDGGRAITRGDDSIGDENVEQDDLLEAVADAKRKLQEEGGGDRCTKNRKLSDNMKSEIDDSDSHDDDGSANTSDDEADPLIQSSAHPSRQTDVDGNISSDSPSTSDDSSDDSSSNTSSDDDNERRKRIQINNPKSSSSQTNQSEREECEPDIKSIDELETDGGFLVSVVDPKEDVFAHAKEHIPERVTGDKSKGWATQRQKLGQQRKKRGHPQDRWRK